MAPPSTTTSKKYPTYKYNLRKRAAPKPSPIVSFDDIISSDDEIKAPITRGRKKKSRDKSFKPPEDSSSSSSESNESSSSSSDESDDDDYDEFAEYINCKRPKLDPSASKQDRIRSSFFRLLKHNKLGKTFIKLFILTKGRKPLCNEFTWNKNLNCFKCLDCSMKADVFKSEKGRTYVKLSAPFHKCPPRIYDPEKFQHKIIKKPFFKVVEYQSENVTKRKLHVFDSTNFEMGYEYVWFEDSQEFRCGPCANRICVRAKLFIDENGEECLQCGKREHICTQRPLTEGNLVREKRILSESDFTILTTGKKRNLIVFDSEDRTKCYKYYWAPSSNVFICNGCRSRNFYVYARFKTGGADSDAEKNIILSETNHVCPLLDYKPLKEAAENSNSEEISSGFEYFTAKNHPPKIFLFLDDEKNECYEFAAIKHHGEYSDKFFCLGCSNSPIRPRVIAKVILSKNSDNQNSLKILQPQHTCNAKKYDPKKYSKTIVKSPNFLFCQYKDEITTKLLIFHPEGQRKSCYMYGFNRDFQCVKCRKQKKFLSAQVFQDEKGKECVSFKSFDHVCDPLDYDEISEDCQIMKSSGLFKRKIKIKKGEYEFRKIDSRSEAGYLLIFDPKDKTKCFHFRRDPRTRDYFCISCKEMGQTITAKLCKRQKIEVEGDEHICKPVKYEPIENILESSNYKVFKNKHGTEQLAVFTSDDKKIGYQYGYIKDKKAFICYRCREHRPLVLARIRQKVNGEEYLQLSPNKHLCKPKVLNFD